MSSEFLMPQKYEGYDCGLTVVVCGLDDNIKYDKITLYLEDRDQNKYNVDINSEDTFKTTKVTFGGLQENRFYNVIAELDYNGESVKIQAKMVPTVNKMTTDAPTRSLFSLRGNDTVTPKYRGGGLPPSAEKCQPKILKG